jgi:multimeric flavodoxin WrbA
MSGNTEKMAKAVAEGAASVKGIKVTVKKAADVSVEDFKSSDAFAFGTPDYFSYMAGMLKDMFDRVFYAAKAHTEGKPCVCFLTHGGGGKAIDSLERMCVSFRFKRVRDILSINSPVLDKHLGAARQLGKTLAQNLL